MTTTPAAGDTSIRTVDDQFLELICSDPDLLAAEFDTIVAAEWAQPPTDRHGREAADRHPGSDAARPDAEPVRGPVPCPQYPGLGRRARQRSPPARLLTHDTQPATWSWSRPTAGPRPETGRVR